jgi:hypothetical protein
MTNQKAGPKNYYNGGSLTWGRTKIVLTVYNNSRNEELKIEKENSGRNKITNREDKILSCPK